MHLLKVTCVLEGEVVVVMRGKMGGRERKVIGWLWRKRNERNGISMISMYKLINWMCDECVCVCMSGNCIGYLLHGSSSSFSNGNASLSYIKRLLIYCCPSYCHLSLLSSLLFLLSEVSFLLSIYTSFVPLNNILYSSFHSLFLPNTMPGHLWAPLALVLLWSLL